MAQLVTSQHIYIYIWINQSISINLYRSISINQSTIHPKLFTNEFPSRFSLYFFNFYGNSLRPPFFCKKNSNQNQLTSPDRCGVFCFFGGGGLENIFCNFYEINSSQEFFWYCKKFGVDGISINLCMDLPVTLFLSLSLSLFLLFFLVSFFLRVRLSLFLSFPFLCSLSLSWCLSLPPALHALGSS